MNRLCLGTAQLGMDYGVCNTTGKPSYEEAKRIIETAWEWGIEYFDTAQAYGDSEKILGNIFKELGIKPKIITKIKMEGYYTEDEIEYKLQSSLDRLGIDCIWGLMMHSKDTINEKEIEVAHRLKIKNKIKEFGYSCYSPRKAKEILISKGVDVIQVPFNLYDQRALQVGLFDYFENCLSSKKIFVRSIFLQGKLVKNYGIHDCLSFVNSYAKDSNIVVGVETTNQLIGILESYNKHIMDFNNAIDFSRCNYNLNIIDPRKWGKGK